MSESSDPRNVPGDYYVESDCCTLCGVPWHIAPDLFSYDDKCCWVKKQPETLEERGRMLDVIETQELNCIRSRTSEGR